jgi:hypothetical protein
MAWNNKIELGQWSESIVNYEPVRTTTWTTVFANKKSVGQKEYYNGVAANRKPDIVYEVRSSQFINHEMVRIGSKVYDIIRTYADGEITELFLSAVEV